MTNPVRERCHFEVLDLVVISTDEGLQLTLQTLGAAVVPLAPHALPAFSPAGGGPSAASCSPLKPGQS
jgi:hypothetical protein